MYLVLLTYICKLNICHRLVYVSSAAAVELSFQDPRCVYVRFN